MQTRSQGSLLPVLGKEREIRGNVQPRPQLTSAGSPRFPILESEKTLGTRLANV